MNTFSLFKDIYAKAFETFKIYQISLLKICVWFVVATIATGLFAVMYRLATGFFGI